MTPLPGLGTDLLSSRDEPADYLTYYATRFDMGKSKTEILRVAQNGDRRQGKVQIPRRPENGLARDDNEKQRRRQHPAQLRKKTRCRFLALRLAQDKSPTKRSRDGTRDANCAARSLRPPEKRAQCKRDDNVKISKGNGKRTLRRTREECGTRKSDDSVKNRRPERIT